MADAKRSRARKASRAVETVSLAEVLAGPESEAPAASSPAQQQPSGGEIHCRHIPAATEFLRMYHAAARALRWGPCTDRACGECGRRGGVPLYACLQCVSYGCWSPELSSEAMHLAAHTAETGHALSIEVDSGVLRCAVCRVFLWNDRLAAVWSFARYSSAPECPAVFAVGQAEAAAPAAFERHCVAVRGLYNLGNTCYMNSVLQLLVHTPPLRRHFLGPSAPEAHGHDARGAKDCVACEMDALFCAMAAGPTAPHVPSRLLGALWSSFPRDLAGYAQQDAHEFLTALRQALHAAVRRKPGSAAHGGTPCDCVVHRVLGGTLQSDVVCASCGGCTSTQDPFLDLSLDLCTYGAATARPRGSPPKGGAAAAASTAAPVALEDCLAAFVREERLQLHGGHYSCASCNESRSEIRKRLSILRAPPILTVHLKRFEHGVQSAKVDTPVAAPLVLDLAPYMASGVPPGGVHYHLYGMISHVGTLDSGHYTAYVRHGGDGWFHVDDGLATLVSWKRAVSHVGTVYMLFYARDASESA